MINSIDGYFVFYFNFKQVFGFLDLIIIKLFFIGLFCYYFTIEVGFFNEKFR
ncbi:hypothetical protein PROVRUST_05735 [Providencia rustigianii DSM 4541]|uniref:Uncharacterized protein n=1 Tax=Providencia rustigianii DSM 4541 TaxID=500637 RepID=D1P0R7_9GAMM|nr:hypothetical protein PROVRUST_05735 [Providencia rustigianii DSM 4541]